MGMTKEQKPYFELLNTNWTLLKPYADEKDLKAYKQIMSDLTGLMFKDRGERYTDEWWDTTRDMIDYPERYRGTKYVDFATELTIGIIDYFQLDMILEKQNKKTSYYDFMNHVCGAFINEWERVK